MSLVRDLGPFQPGTGGLPPYLAGREDEQTRFRRFFRTLQKGVPAPSEIILYGPRGNGKTALLRWVKQEAQAEGGLDTYWLTGSDVPQPADLVQRLKLGSLLEKLAPESVSVAGLAVSLRQAQSRPLLSEALEARARVRPLLVLLDEAHTLEPQVGQWLLNAAQMAGREAPFLLVLAGTPDLRARLSEMGASFWSRAETLPVGRLSTTATAEAIRRPLAADGIEIEAEALARIVRESHGYPFFVQIWGQVVWDGVRQSGAGSTVTPAVVAAAAPRFEGRRNFYYYDRLQELDKRALLPAAREVAAAFRGGDRLGYTDFRTAVARGVGDAGAPSRAEAADALEHLGFVWQTEGIPTWEPGIPSLMDYILEHAPASGADTATR